MRSQVHPFGEFSFGWNPSEKRMGEISAAQPQNPFLTKSYLEARRLLGYRPVSFVLQSGGGLVAACTAFSSFGRIHRACEIPSTPAAPRDSAFWQGLLGFCSSHRITRLGIDSYASSHVDIPRLPGETGRRERFEFLYDLGKAKSPAYSPNHRRNINRARRFDLHLRVADDEQACKDHVRLIACSVRRRRDRNERVSTPVTTEEIAAFVRSGAGRIFRAEKDRQPFSSILILLAPKGAYYHSAGSSPEGMRTGSSHFLVDEAAQYLRAEGLELFNLGGAEPWNPGLERFKSEFGTARNTVESVTILPGALSARLLRLGSRLVRLTQPREWVHPG